jgi:5-methylcytosine-specific restriction endonuclease McrA
MLSENYVTLDNQSIISDITESTNLSDNSEEFLQKKTEINKILDVELSKLNTDSLKDKCKEYNITILSKMKKQDIINILNVEFEKYWNVIRSKKLPELKNICKLLDIKGIGGLKKDILCYQIMTYYASKIIINPDLDNKKELLVSQIVLENINDPTSIEELEKQKFEIEKKMMEVIEKQKQAELEKQRQAELEKQRQAELEKQKQAELEKQRQEELEKQKQEELEKQKQEEKEYKKKKQSIPKNVRIIVWNHYIGEDIIKHKCLCCKKVVISNTNFEVGHVISEKNGGTHEINNLRPICFACNHSMGAENMIDFVVKYGLYIG